MSPAWRQALRTALRLGPLAVLAGAALVARSPQPALEVARPATEVAAPNLAQAGGNALALGPLRGWQRLAGGWLLRFQPAHGAWLLAEWVPDDGGLSQWRLEVASWLPGARLSERAAACWVGPAVGVAREQLARRDWWVSGQALAGALPVGGSLPRAEVPALPLGNAVLAGLLLVGAVTRRWHPAGADRVWVGLMGVGCVGLMVLAPVLSPLGARLYGVEVRPSVTALAWAASMVILMGGVLFTALTCPEGRSSGGCDGLVWGFLLGVVAGGLAPVGWIAEVASLPAHLPALGALALILGWLAGLAGEGLTVLLAPVGRLGRFALVLAAGAVVWSGGEWTGVGLAVVAAAAAVPGRRAWMGLAVMSGVLTGSLAAVCLWPAAQWLAWGAAVCGVAATATLWLAASGRVQSGS